MCVGQLVWGSLQQLSLVVCRFTDHKARLCEKSRRPDPPMSDSAVPLNLSVPCAQQVLRSGIGVQGTAALPTRALLLVLLSIPACVNPASLSASRTFSSLVH